VEKPRVAIVVEHYLPGFRAGGPLRSVSALVQLLGEEVDFWVITRDRDEGSEAAYPNVRPGEWTRLGKSHVRYLSPDELNCRRLTKAVTDVQPHALYLNSFFSPMTIKLLAARRAGALGAMPVLLAPRGELSPGALRLKALKKRTFLFLSQLARVHEGVVFHASTEREGREITGVLGSEPALLVARNPVTLDRASTNSPHKTSGAIRFVYLSRIARKKNLHVAIDLLRSLHGAVEFNVYGPVDDDAYWQECCALIDEMPPNVAITYRGPIAHDQVASTLSEHHCFVFPTASENFGHAIVEAFRAGCPVITSDQTPWVGLSQHRAGWDLRLDDRASWRRVLQEYVDMDAADYARASADARAFGDQIASTDTVCENRDLFQVLLAGAGGSQLSRLLPGT
jgi:glycosyltransferase involved in cell wall biosynthesis